MTTFQVITDDKLLLLFQEETYKRLDVRFPLEYLKRGQVTALIENANGRKPKIYGGYAVITEGPFRALEQVPQDVVKDHSYLKHREKRCFEVNALWMDYKGVPPFSRFKLWASLFVSMMKTAASGKFYFVYSFDTSKNKLGDIYAGLKPTRIFQGEVRALDGMAQPTLETVEICSFKNVTLAVLGNPDFFLARMKRKKTHLDRVAYASRHH